MEERGIRIFEQEDGKQDGDQRKSGDTINVRLKDVFPLLADALLTQRSWLADFGDDEIEISGDLYDVLMAYRYFRMLA